jgi:hypothetical protein
MSNKSVFWLIFFSLTLIEIGQMADSQEHPVVIDHQQVETNKTAVTTSHVAKTQHLPALSPTDCENNFSGELLVSNIEQAPKVKASATLINQLWMPAYLQ